MADEYKEMIDSLAADLVQAAKMKLADARALAREYLPKLARWTAEANAAEAEGNLLLAKKKRTSVKHFRHAAVLDLAIYGIDATNRIERTVLAAFDKALSKIG